MFKLLYTQDVIRSLRLLHVFGFSHVQLPRFTQSLVSNVMDPVKSIAFLTAREKDSKHRTEASGSKGHENASWKASLKHQISLSSSQ